MAERHHLRDRLADHCRRGHAHRRRDHKLHPTLEAPLVVDGTFNVAATNSYYGLFMDSYTR